MRTSQYLLFSTHKGCLQLGIRLINTILNLISDRRRLFLQHLVTQTTTCNRITQLLQLSSPRNIIFKLCNNKCLINRSSNNKFQRNSNKSANKLGEGTQFRMLVIPSATRQPLELLLPTTHHIRLPFSKNNQGSRQPNSRSLLPKRLCKNKQLNTKLHEQQNLEEQFRMILLSPNRYFLNAN